MEHLGKTLVVAGLVLVLAGGILWALRDVKGLPLGRLPGDFSVEREGFSFHAPIATMLLVSVALTLVLNLAARFLR